MDIRDAIEQYAEMVVLGTQAMRRLGQKELEPTRFSELVELTDEIAERVDQLKKLASSDRP